MPIPLAYLITFTCYGTRLRGDESGSVDRKHNPPGTPLIPPRPSWIRADATKMKEQPYQLTWPRRAVVLQAMQEVCAHRGWTLLAAHVRSNHVHFVVIADERPERVLNDVKAYASRALSRSGLENGSLKRWTHHGSTRYLWKPEQVAAAIEYVVWGQGEPMAVWRKQGETWEERSDTG